jgi:hypothetical protein
MQFSRYKLKNNTPNSVLNSLSNTANIKRMRLKEPKLCSAKCMPSLYLSSISIVWFDNIPNPAWLSKAINRYIVDISLKLSIEIRIYFCTESNGGIFIYIAYIEPKIRTSKWTGRNRLKVTFVYKYCWSWNSWIVFSVLIINLIMVLYAIHTNFFFYAVLDTFLKNKCQI